MRNYLTRLNTPKEISYEIKNDYLTLFGYQNRELYRYISANSDIDEDISITIYIEKKKFKIFWDDEKEAWYLQSGVRNQVPNRGLLKIEPIRELHKFHDNQKFV